jgi:hypothetical protein
MLYVHCSGKFILNRTLMQSTPLQTRPELGKF